MYKSNTEEMHAINRDTQEHIDSCHKEYESCAAYPENSTAHLNNAANITVDIDSITQQRKKWEREK